MNSKLTHLTREIASAICARVERDQATKYGCLMGWAKDYGLPLELVHLVSVSTDLYVKWGKA